MMKFRPTVIMLIIGIVVFITGTSLISIGVTTKLPVNDSRMQERQGNASVLTTNGGMIGAGISVTVVGLGLATAGGLLTWRKRN
jgi:hypothetical protein